MDKYSLAHEEADRLTTRQGKRDEKKRKGERERKKDVGSSSLKVRVPPQVATSQTILARIFFVI